MPFLGRSRFLVFLGHLTKAKKALKGSPLRSLPAARGAGRTSPLLGRRILPVTQDVLTVPYSSSDPSSFWHQPCCPVSSHGGVTGEGPCRDRPCFSITSPVPGIARPGSTRKVAFSNDIANDAEGRKLRLQTAQCLCCASLPAMGLQNGLPQTH